MDKEKLIAVGVFLVVLSPTRGYTQSEATRGKTLWGGVTLGAGFFEVAGKGIDGPTSSGEFKPGFTSGTQLSYDIHRLVALHAEMLFAKKGSHHMVLDERLASYVSDYLELPLLARVSLPSIRDTLLPFVAAGPWVGFLLNVKGEDVQQGEPLDLDGVYKSTDFGLIFAAGAAVRVTPYDSLGLELRYDMGLRAVVNDRDTINNRGILLVLGYQTCICSRNAAR